MRPSSARARSAIPSAVSPRSASSSARSPCSTKASGSPIDAPCVPGHVSAMRARTYAPKPPTVPPSSTVRTCVCAGKRRASVSSSSGLMKRALTTVALTPSRASRSAAASAGRTMVPTARIATSRPCRSVSQRPYSVAGISATGRGSAGTVSRGMRMQNGPAFHSVARRRRPIISSASLGAVIVIPGTGSM